jgi:hypothetical protein
VASTATHEGRELAGQRLADSVLDSSHHALFLDPGQLFLHGQWQVSAAHNFCGRMRVVRALEATGKMQTDDARSRTVPHDA